MGMGKGDDDGRSRGDGEEVRGSGEDLEMLKSIAKEYESKYKYLLADYDNYRKRVEREAEYRVRQSIESFVLKLLNLRDDFTRAIDAAKNGADRRVLEGLEGVLKNLDGILRDAGVVEIPSIGKVFDPNVHEAVSFTYNSELPDLTITNEIRKGYMMNDRVIRPSLVEVSRRPVEEGGGGAGE
ncbi:MAG: nucleotide exchange factor GrpE [Candidatus Nitrosocaldus sp.]|nr:nucleotide exchange factor GrpE [Candidatus Nitrosocaldus sp.]MDW8275715.1 nucleotide exchange factor GrpE [Candidatus Nitrosocaldus sp.]